MCSSQVPYKNSINKSHKLWPDILLVKSIVVENDDKYNENNLKQLSLILWRGYSEIKIKVRHEHWPVWASYFTFLFW